MLSLYFMSIFVQVKYLVSIVIIFILIFQSGVNTFFLFNYHRSLASYEAICVNKDKPEMKCHGKCKMMEETKRFGFLEDKNDKQPNAPHLKSIKHLDLFFSSEMEPKWNLALTNDDDSIDEMQLLLSAPVNIPYPPPEQV